MTRVGRSMTMILTSAMLMGCCLFGCESTEKAEPVPTGPTLSLFDAAKRGDAEAAKRFIAEGHRVDGRQAGYRPIHWAARRGHLEVAKVLIAGGADPYLKNDDGKTALHFAAENGHAEMVLFLLQCRADPNVKDKVRMTPLHLAAYNDHLPTVLVLLEYGADTKAISGTTRQTAEMLAFWKGHHDVAKAIREFDSR